MPIPKVKGVSEAEVFKVVKTGKTRREYWETWNFCIQCIAKTCFLLAFNARLVMSNVVHSQEKPGKGWWPKCVMLGKVSLESHPNMSALFDQWWDYHMHSFVWGGGAAKMALHNAILNMVACCAYCSHCRHWDSRKHMWHTQSWKPLSAYQWLASRKTPALLCTRHWVWLLKEQL